MTLITGILADSGNLPANGTLRVTLDSLLVDDSQSPDVTLTQQLHNFAIANGVINLNLPESETSLITYRFEFYPTGQTTSVMDFRARVPNVVDIEFSQLVPTGLTTDTLDTSIRRLAQIITQDPNYRTAIQSPKFKGNYSPTTVYKPGDAVNSGIHTWVWYNDAPGSGQTPTEPSNYWQKLSLVA